MSTRKKGRTRAASLGLLVLICMALNWTLAQNCWPQSWSDINFIKSATVAEVEACLESGTWDVEARSTGGRTALHFAARYNSDPAVIAALIEAGARVNARNRAGNTPLQFAILFSRNLANPAIIEALIKVSQLNTRNLEGETPLHLAAKAADGSRIVKALLEAGAVATIPNKDGLTSLHSAAFSGSPESLRLLLASMTASPGQIDPSTLYTSLHLAAGFNADPDITIMLLNAGADVNARSPTGLTALHLAAGANPNPDVIAILLDAGADGAAQDQDGKTPADFALGRLNDFAGKEHIYWRLHDAQFETR